jgi:hypothetical protein
MRSKQPPEAFSHSRRGSDLLSWPCLRVDRAFRRFAVLATAVSLVALLPRAFSQGCIPAHYMSLSLGAEGITYLAPGQWEGDVSYRYLHSEDVFFGTQEQPQLHDVGGRNTIHSIDLTASYAISSRFSLSLVLPFEHDEFSLPNDDHVRYSGSTGGLGDIRFLANAWILAPAQHPNGNVNLGLGIKFPTGDYRATADWHTSDGQVILRPVDIAAQLGDGGVGAVVQLQAFQKLVKNLFGYVAGLYLINPRNVNGTEGPSLNTTYVNSVPDQYFGRGGLSYVIWPAIGLSFSLGGRIDGVPTSDLIGSSDGFRRAGYAIYVDPGLNWSRGKNSLSLNVPVAVERNLEATRYSSKGAFADFIVVASYSRRF